MGISFSLVLLLLFVDSSPAQTGRLSDVPFFFESAMGPEHTPSQLPGLFSHVPRLNEGSGLPDFAIGHYCTPFHPERFATCIRFPDSGFLDSLRDAVSLGHRYPALDPLGQSITTLITFLDEVYHVSQYSPAGTADGDTLWIMTPQSRPLPTDPHAPLIWIEGVGRISGRVGDSLTLLCSDSLFIMDNLTTTETILNPCEDPDVYGMNPQGSSIQLGLIGEKDVILAATVPNGLGNGQGPGQGLPEGESNLQSCGQADRDVIVAASVIAMRCVFESEFWKTSVQPRELGLFDGACGGLVNSEVQFFEAQRPAEEDQRGTIWFCGSLAAKRPGYLHRRPQGPWGSARIGYPTVRMRYDPNLNQSAPPFWPLLEEEAVDWIEVDVETGPASSCGPIANLEEFLSDWNEGRIAFRLRHGSPLPMLVELNCKADTFVLAAEEELLPPGEWLELPLPTGFWLPEHEIELGFHFSVARAGARIEGTPCAFFWDPHTAFSAGLKEEREGSLCSAPNPANGIATIEWFMPRADPVVLDVYDLRGRWIERLHEGYAIAGWHHVTWDSGRSPIASGIYFLRLHGDRTNRISKLVVLK